MFVQSKNIEVENTSSSTTVPPDAVSRLRYFLSCICSVVPALNENGKLSQIINYSKPLNLNSQGADSLIELCKSCFAATNDKCIFMAPELCKGGN